MTVELTDSNFEEQVLNSDKPVLVDFWATWCGPCLTIAPLLEEIAQEFEGKAIVGKVDVDSNPQTAQKFGVRNIPTLLIFKNGEVVDKQVGAAPKKTLVEKLQQQVEASA